jgi:hypothetical protein
MNEKIKPNYYLCKPDLKRTTIGNLTEAMNDSQTISNGNINDLSFDIPLYIKDKNKTKIRNKHIDMIKERFLIRFEKGNYTEWYVIDNISKIMDSKDYYTVKCFSLGYQLNSKLIKNYSVESYNAGQMLYDVLKETIWSIGFIDPQFNLKYRTFDFSGSVLSAVQEISIKFSALIVWDTINRQVNFYDPETYGVNKGFKVSFGKLMKDVKQEINIDEFCTRLKLFGKDGMSIQSVNPSGTNFIQDFSYFMYPFEQDVNGIIINHSHYMSDSLCMAIKNYNNLVTSNQTSYSNLLNQKTQQDIILATKQTEISTLENELDIITDNLDTYNARNPNNAENPNYTLINQRVAKSNQVSAKQTEIDSVTSQINNIKASMTTLDNLLRMENSLSSDQIKELNDFIIEKEFTDDNYSDPKELLEDGKKEFDKIREPKIVVSMSIVNFYDILSEKHNWDKLSIGDVVTVQHSELGINIRANLAEMKINGSNITITVSNEKELLSDEDRFLKDHMKNISSSNVIDMSKHKWDDAKATVDDVSLILENKWDAAKRSVNAGNNEDVEISRRGIIVRDPSDPLKMLIMQHGQIAMTNDGGSTFRLGIDASGVYAQYLVGKIILGNKLMISDDNGTFTIEGNLLTIRDNNKDVRVQLGEYTTGKYGLRIVSKLGDVVLSEDGIVQVDSVQLAENVDSTHGLKLKFYIDNGMISIRNVMLNFTLERFRAYSKGAASGGGGSVTSASGGGTSTSTQSGGYRSTSTSSGGSHSATTGAEYWNSTGNVHNHGIERGTRLAVHSSSPVAADWYVPWVPSGEHNHSFNVPSHTHEMIIPDHAHYFTVPDHSHYVGLPDHTHAIDYGIYESTYATGVRIVIDGVIRGGTYSSSENNVDITQWISTTGWHTVELTSTQLGRINAGLYMKTFVGF